MAAGQFHTASALFRAFADPTPDRWGQALLRRAERGHARREGRTPRALGPVDFLTLVHDETRLGALRFRDATAGKDSTFLSSTDRPVPPLLHLARLLAATNRIADDSASDDDLALLLAPGTSLGGARPKASVRGKGHELLIAKFPRDDDEWPVTAWEATALSLAVAAGIHTPEFRLQAVGKKSVLLVKRFDRDGQFRIPFMSAMTAVSAEDNQPHSYLEIADAIRRDGSQVNADLRELWRRLVFNVLVSNTDDHLRNHGFVRDGIGWRLAPAYDLNPTPADVRPRVHALALNENDATASMEVALEVAPRFGIVLGEAREIGRQVATTVRSWRSAARKMGLKAKNLDRMESAFEHEDAVTALK